MAAYARVSTSSEEQLTSYEAQVKHYTEYIKSKETSDNWQFVDVYTDKAERRQRIELFLHMLEEQKECADFEPGMFVALVDKVIIQHDGHMGFCFRNGMKCEYPQ